MAAFQSRLRRAGRPVHRRRGGGDGGARRRRLPGHPGRSAACRATPSRCASGCATASPPSPGPGAAASGAIVALGLGVLVVLAMSLVERRLTRQLAAGAARERAERLPGRHPAGPVAGRRAAPPAGGAPGIESVPVVMARVSAIDGVPPRSCTEDAAARKDGERNGERGGSGGPPLGAHPRAAPHLHAGAAEGQQDRRGRPVERSRPRRGQPRAGVRGRHRRPAWARRSASTSRACRSTSRSPACARSNWQTFGINFFLVVEPGVLESRAPAAAGGGPPAARRRAAGAGPAGGRATRTSPCCASARSWRRSSRCCAGSASASASSAASRWWPASPSWPARSAPARPAAGREVALLKTLGMTRRGVAATFAVEYALIGLVAGIDRRPRRHRARLGGRHPRLRDPLGIRPSHRSPSRSPAASLLAVLAGLAASLPRPGAAADRGAAGGVERTQGTQRTKRTRKDETPSLPAGPLCPLDDVSKVWRLTARR